MDKIFSSLETKVDRVIAQCDLLRQENQRLRQELVARNAETRALSDRMDEARQRLEQLASKVTEPV